MAPTRRNTIYLTPEEDKRIRKSFQDRLQKCQELSGQPREPDDSQDRRRNLTAASLMSDMALGAQGLGMNQQEDTMVTLGVGRPYPPCTKLLRDLQPITLTELRMDEHHRGRVLTVKRTAPVTSLKASSWTMVKQDGLEDSDDSERLEIVLHRSKQMDGLLEAGSIFQIKEPYYTLSDQGDPTLRIDHPSDLIIHPKGAQVSNQGTSGGDAEPSTAFHKKDPSKTAAESAKFFKDDGNKALQKGSLLRAHGDYSQGLRLLGSAEDSLVHDLHRNRAHVNLALGRFDEAESDGLAAVTKLDDENHKSLDAKAYYRAGSAAYSLGQFESAKGFFEEQSKLMPGDELANVSLKRAKVRLKEQESGSYNFQKIRAAMLMGRPRVDAATFSRNVTVKDSPGRGRGLFATKDMKPGDIVLCEKAFTVVWGHEDNVLTALTYDTRDDRIRVFPVGLVQAIVQKLRDNPSQVTNVMGLYSDHHTMDEPITADDETVIDTFQVHDIVARNAFGPGPVYQGGRPVDEDASHASTGLWVLTSRANHSCVSNTNKEALGDLMILRATRPIKAGDEVTHSYDESSDYETRAASLMTTWGFECTCKLCETEKSEDAAVREKRKGLESQVAEFMGNCDAAGAKRLQKRKAQGLARSLNETYDDKKYDGLPRLALGGIQRWLSEAGA
ncbi:tetratricopeptide [Xylariomycetidae sp. FL2044]|nr:tetratricopeptide [Xylariomycetidae sp. FL2044]